MSISDITFCREITFFREIYSIEINHEKVTVALDEAVQLMSVEDYTKLPFIQRDFLTCSAKNISKFGSSFCYNSAMKQFSANHFISSEWEKKEKVYSSDWLMQIAAAASVLGHNQIHKASYLNMDVLSKIQLQHSTFKQKLPCARIDVQIRAT